MEVSQVIPPEQITIIPQEIYSLYLEIIGNVTFTQREIDIIACLLAGRASKKIASFLSISPRTVDNHIRNIMLKLGLNSRESLIDFFEKSGKYIYLKNYYLSILIQKNFERELEKIAKFLSENNDDHIFVYCEKKNKITLFSCVRKHLGLAGIKFTILDEAKIKSQNFVNKIESSKKCNIIYFLPLEGTENSNVNLAEHIKNINSIQPFIAGNESTLLLILEKNISTNVPKELSKFKYIDFSQHSEYYSLIFDLLKKIYPSVSLENNISAFNQHNKKLLTLPQLQEIGIDEGPLNNLVKNRFEMTSKNNRKRSLTIMLTSTILISILVIVLSITHREEMHIIRSQLLLPQESILLKRPFEMQEIDKKIIGSKGIQTVVLTGIGGSGKTTLSQLYARSQNARVVWMIDAETKESLVNSFEKLAYAISETETEKKILRGIQEIKNDNEREEKLTRFVNEKLKTISNWFLIYDNVEVFNKILKFFPLDPEVWGKGKIIITTRDNNIRSNKYINPNNVINIKELDKEQKFFLFTKILYESFDRKLDISEKNQIEEFLKEIPPFPLDVSTAAVYIKDTKISYEEYLKKMQSANHDFDLDQEAILKSTGDYAKTRYEIVTVALRKIIEEHVDFKDLLLFISMLDSQNLPRELLSLYKTDTTVAQFIRSLKKYSFILDEEEASNFSIHRSIQTISLSYLIKSLNLQKGDPLIKAIALILEDYMFNTSNNEDALSMKFLGEHAEKFLKHNNLLTEAIKGHITAKLGYIYSYRGLYSKPKELLEQSLKILNEHDRENHAAIAQCLFALGNVYWNGGHYQEGQNIAMKVLDIYQTNLPNTYARIAQTLRFIGNVSRALGNYGDALLYLEKSLNIYRKSGPQNELGFAGSLSLLGFTYYDLGYYKKAQELLEASLEIYKKYPKGYYGYGRALSILGMTYKKLNHYIMAKKLIMEAHNIYTQSLAGVCFITAWNLAHLGSVYAHLGDYKQGKELLKQSIDVHNNSFGANHFETVRLLSDLGYAYLLEGNLEDAEKTFKEALQRFQQNKHLDIYIVLENLASVYIKKYEYEVNKGNKPQSLIFKNQSIDYLKQALEIVKSRLPANSPHITRIEDKLKEWVDYKISKDSKKII